MNGHIFCGYTSCTDCPGLTPEHTHTHTHPFNGPFPGLPRSAGTRQVKTNLDFTEARDSERQWHKLGHMQVYTSLQTYTV